jgi:hypothetical protein
MTRACLFWLALTSLVLVSGCGSNNAGKIEGTSWKSLAVPGDEFEDGKDAPAGEVRIEFTKGGVVYLRGPIGVFDGKYTLGSGDWVTLHLDRELDGKKTHTERVIINGNRMTMSGSRGLSTAFERDN